MGFIGDRPNGVPQIESSIMRMLDSGLDFDPGRAPTTYIENHDHLRFMRKAGGREFWFLTQPYVIALFTTAGAPLIYNGQEFAADNDMPEDGLGRVIPRPVVWDELKDTIGESVFDLYSKMIRIRRNHPGLRSSNFYPRGWEQWQIQLNPQGFGIDRARNIVVYHRWGNADDGKLERFYIVLNFSKLPEHVSFEVPDSGPWIDLINDDTLTPKDGRLHADIGSNWGAVFYQKS